MVDRDKLERLRNKKSGKSSSGGGSKKKSSSKSGKKKKRSKKKTKKEKTKKQKLEEFKGGSSSGGGGDGTGDIKRLLFTLGSIDLFTRRAADYEEDGMNPANKTIKEDVGEEVVGEVTSFLGVFDVPQIADRYGYSWDNIIRVIPSNDDRVGDTLETNDGNVKKRDVKSLLKCIANILLFAEGTKVAKENKPKKDRRDRVTMKFTGVLHNYYNELISESQVQRISEKYGFDWKEDILMDVLENQDFEKELKK